MLRPSRYSHKLAFAVMVVLLRGAMASAEPVAPVPADQFASSIGTQYTIEAANTPPYLQGKADLQAMGIRHNRANLWGADYAHYLDLANSGVRTQVFHSWTNNAGIDALIKKMRNMADAIEGVEGANEPDLGRHSDGSRITVQETFDYQKYLYKTIKADPVFGAPGKNIPVLAPSIVTSGYASDLANYADLDGKHIWDYVDLANSHPYAIADNHSGKTNNGINGDGATDPDPPEYNQNVLNQLGYARRTAPGRPIYSTETSPGGGTNIGTHAGIYAPRLLFYLFQYPQNSARTYYFELINFNSYVGLYQVVSGSEDEGVPRPQAWTLKHLIGPGGLLDDPPYGQTFKVTPLDYTLSGDIASLYSQLFQRRDGMYYLALWRAYRATSSNKANITLMFHGGFLPTTLKTYTDLDESAMTTATLTLTTMASFPVGARVVVVEIAGTVHEPMPTASRFWRYFDR